MEDYVYNIYLASALDFGSGTVALADDYDPMEDLAVLTVSDNDELFEGDTLRPEQGDDRSQFGELRDIDGNLLIGGPANRVYLEEAWQLVGDDGSVITLYRVEIAETGGKFQPGTFAGYVADGILQPGVVYDAILIDVTPTNPPFYDELVSPPICFTPGTLIDTPDGPRPVEDLAPGDSVLTRDHGAQTLRWVGKRVVGPADIAANPALRPVLIRKDALGPGRPARDMRVSPQHRILMAGAMADLLFGQPEWLAPAIGLVNDRTILRDPAPEGVTYLHLLFDGHQIVTADGVETESFHPGAWGLSTLDAAARAELFAIFPALEADPVAAGPAARPALKPREARILARHLPAST